jgi:hypothetical protein
MKNHLLNEQDRLLEALWAVSGNPTKDGQEGARAFAERWLDSSRKSIQNRAMRIVRLSGW